LQEVEAALLEAADNVRFLAPLRRHLERLSMMDDFVALVRAYCNIQKEGAQRRDAVLQSTRT
jgi:hypothetical protein